MARAMQVMPNARFVLTPPPKAYTAQQNTPACARARTPCTQAHRAARAPRSTRSSMWRSKTRRLRADSLNLTRGAGRGGAGLRVSIGVRVRYGVGSFLCTPAAIAKKALKTIVVAKCASFFSETDRSRAAFARLTARTQTARAHTHSAHIHARDRRMRAVSARAHTYAHTRTRAQTRAHAHTLAHRHAQALLHAEIESERRRQDDFERCARTRADAHACARKHPTRVRTLREGEIVRACVQAGRLC